MYHTTVEPFNCLSMLEESSLSTSFTFYNPDGIHKIVKWTLNYLFLELLTSLITMQALWCSFNVMAFHLRTRWRGYESSLRYPDTEFSH